MSFLQPILLAGLPLAALPIIIHLINRQRYRTVRWAAMMFLLDAQRMNRGMARLRYWLIMAMRMLAIALLVFAASRPLVSGWLGLSVGGRPDTVIIVLDRSASMEQQNVQTSQSKRSTGLQKLTDLTETWGSGSQFVLIENTQNTPRELEPDEPLTGLPETTATATSANIPAMLSTALDYIVANQTGQTDVWICSDLRQNDWNTDDGRWSDVRQGFERLPGVRFYLLSYPDRADGNLAAWVSNVRRRQIGQVSELVLDVNLKRELESDEPLSVPLEIVINGARSVVNVEMTEREFVLQGHPIALDASTTTGWGRVAVPTDANPQDNEFCFVFAEPPEHRTAIVSSDPGVAELLELAVTSPVDGSLLYEANSVTPEDVDQIDWEATSFILWQAPLPDGVVADELEAFVRSGRPIIFLPPDQPEGNELFGTRWAEWQQTSDEPLRVATWRGESDLLSHTAGGEALPVGELQILQHCSFTGDGTVLAQLGQSGSLLARRDDADGPVYFLSTLPGADHSNLAQQGVVFYVMLHRALSVGASLQGRARHLVAGSPAAHEVSLWRPLSGGPEELPSPDQSLQIGAFEEGDQLVALNRPAAETEAETVDAAAIGQLFSGLDYRLVEDRVGDSAGLASEVWRAFVLAMAAALLVEACLCLPERPSPVAESAFS